MWEVVGVIWNNGVKQVAGTVVGIGVYKGGAWVVRKIRGKDDPQTEMRNAIVEAIKEGNSQTLKAFQDAGVLKVGAPA